MNILVILLACFSISAAAADIHIAPSGSDTNPGTAERPFATLEKAREAIREFGIQNSESRIQNSVVLSAGTYRLTRTFELNEKDSGTTYRAATGADVRLSGSLAVPNSAVKPVTDQATLDRLVPEMRGKVLEIDLKAAVGISDFGDIGPRGFRRPYIPAPLELFVDDTPLALAQWPNPGQAGEPLGKVLDKGSVTRKGEKPTRGGTFTFKTARPARWTQAKDIWITGLFENGYADNTVQVKSLDLTNHSLTTIQPHMYGFSSGHPWNRWTALNLLEEIDLPGEFAADKASGKLYFLPPSTVEGAVPSRDRLVPEPAKDNRRTECASHIEKKLEVSMLKDPMVAIEGATNVVFDGITFENSRGMGVYIERGASNRIQNCTLRNLGMVAVCIGKGIKADPDYRHAFTGVPVSRELGSWHEHIYDNPTFNRDAGTGHGIVNCQIYNIGEGAISLGGGDRKSLTPAGNFVENCDIHDFNRWDRTYRGAVNIDGVGNRVAHCKIHECPGSAIYLHGNDHVIEYNEVFHAMMSGDDMGAFYMGRDPTERGNVIRYNYWHDLATSHATAALYFDDSGGDSTQVYGNIFRRAGAGLGTVFLAGGSDFGVTNNIFSDCRKPLYAQGFRGGAFGLFKKRMADVGYDSPRWKERYPEFQGYLTQKKPHNNLFKPNLIVTGNDPRFADPAKRIGAGLKQIRPKEETNP